MQINNVSQNPTFGAFRVSTKNGSLKRIMRTMRFECNSKDLLRTLQILEKEKHNPKFDIFIEDVGYIGGNPCLGHFRGFVRGETFWNSSSIFSLPTVPEFFEKFIFHFSYLIR